VGVTGKMPNYTSLVFSCTALTLGIKPQIPDLDPPLKQCLAAVIHATADLGMFSMFGRTEAPQKRAPTREEANFLQHNNMPETMGDTRVNE